MANVGEPTSPTGWLDDRFAAALGVRAGASDAELLDWLGRCELEIPLEDESCRILFIEIIRTAQDVLVTYGPTAELYPDRSVPPVAGPVSDAVGSAWHYITGLAMLRIGLDVRDAAFVYPPVPDAIEVLIIQHLIPLVIDAGLFKQIGGSPAPYRGPCGPEPA